MTAPMGRFEAAFVIARRDYTATVLSKTFLFFLLGPLFPILLGVMFGSIGARVADSTDRSRVAVIATPADFARVDAARSDLAPLWGTGSLPDLVRSEPGTDPERLLAAEEPAVVAVLGDPLTRPHLLGAVGPRDPLFGQVQLILARASGATGPLPEVALTRIRQTAGATEAARAITARAGQALLFILTLLLSGMLLSQFIEEKSNKVIEVLAAAVPVESIFMGKLFAMLCMSLTGIAVWASLAVAAAWLLLPAGVLAAVPGPAIGWPAFTLLAAFYYAMSYLLIGAAFLGIGAQASTVREVQTMSMPITMAQVGLFALANVAISDPSGPVGIAAAIFPLSSPLAMIARAALDPSPWPHLVALGWQALWVALILRFAAAWFRRSVLSGPGARPRWWKRTRKVSEPFAG